MTWMSVKTSTQLFRKREDEDRGWKDRHENGSVKKLTVWRKLCVHRERKSCMEQREMFRGRSGRNKGNDDLFRERKSGQGKGDVQYSVQGETHGDAREGKVMCSEWSKGRQKCSTRDKKWSGKGKEDVHGGKKEVVGEGTVSARERHLHIYCTLHYTTRDYQIINNF